MKIDCLTAMQAIARIFSMFDAILMPFGEKPQDAALGELFQRRFIYNSTIYNSAIYNSK